MTVREATFLDPADVVELVRRDWHLPTLGTVVRLYNRSGGDRDLPRSGRLVDLVVSRSSHLEALVLELPDGRIFVARWSQLAGVAPSAPTRLPEESP